MTLEGECSSSSTRCCHNNFIAWQQHLLRVNSEGSSGSAAEEVVVRAKAGTAVVHSKIFNVAVSLCAALRGRRVQKAALGAEERAKLLSINL